MKQQSRSLECPTYKSVDERIYANLGNRPLVEMLPTSARVLDVGCGAGDNARLIRTMNPNCEIYGITHSESEARLAKAWMNQCWSFDIESTLPPMLIEQRFDVLLFSHVLEHFRDPPSILNRYSGLLTTGGHVLIAVPNVLSWRMRLQFLLGRFEYESAGVLDDTHLRFFTYFTADRYLLAKSPALTLVSKSTTGSVPLWWLRRYLLPQSWCERIDQWGCHYWPNLFGGQILIKAIKQ